MVVINEGCYRISLEERFQQMAIGVQREGCEDPVAYDSSVDDYLRSTSFTQITACAFLMISMIISRELPSSSTTCYFSNPTTAIAGYNYYQPLLVITPMAHPQRLAIQLTENHNYNIIDSPLYRCSHLCKLRIEPESSKDTLTWKGTGQVWPWISGVSTCGMDNCDMPTIQLQKRRPHRKEAFISLVVLQELKRIVEDSEIMQDDDAKRPEPG
ncbi:unnamed protein product [Cylicocyclus nassatus]|uniref:Uncharacterized protein n=1 Tax=Cylicocyclus nassatus TaxID=53992 RepID=A0AA36H0F9_CYLNA|nr:unnamed protein product [Cylicocyclus nassatus]